MTEHTSVHPTAVGVVGHPVPYRTPETELLRQWQYARDILNSSEMFEAAAYQELLSAAQNVETDPDRLDRAIEHHTELSARIAADRSAEDGLRSRTRMALLSHGSSRPSSVSMRRRRSPRRTRMTCRSPARSLIGSPWRAGDDGEHPLSPLRSTAAPNER